MKLHYDPETDSLYIELTCAPGAETREISEGRVVDFATGGERDSRTRAGNRIRQHSDPGYTAVDDRTVWRTIRESLPALRRRLAALLGPIEGV